MRDIIFLCFLFSTVANAFKNANISTFTLLSLRVICFLEKNYSHMLELEWWKGIFYFMVTDSDFLLLQFYTWLQVCMIFNDMHLYWCIFVLLNSITETYDNPYTYDIIFQKGIFIVHREIFYLWYYSYNFWKWFPYKDHTSTTREE